MKRADSTASGILVLLILPSCSLLIDSTPDGVVYANGSAGIAGGIILSGGASRVAQSVGGLGGTLNGTPPNSQSAGMSSTSISHAGSTSLEGSAGAGNSQPGGAGAAGGNSQPGGAGGIAGSVITAPRTIGITAARSTVRIVRGQSGVLKVSLQRGNTKGDINLAILGLPPGTAAPSVTVPADSTSADLTIKTASTASVGGPHACTIAATLVDDSTVTTQAAAVLYVADRSGVRDASFGPTGDGTEAHSMGGKAGEVRFSLVDSSGSLDVCGSYWDGDSTEHGWLAQLRPTGALDAKFGADGVLADFGVAPTSVFQIALSTDGLFVSSMSERGPQLSKLDRSGAHDPSYGIGGVVDAGDGLIPLLAFGHGLAGKTVSTNQLNVFKEDGTRETTIPEVGIDAMAVDNQNRIVIAQSIANGSVSWRRVLGDGTVDAAFGTLGATEVHLGAACPSGLTASAPSQLLILPDDGIRAIFSCSGAEQRYLLTGFTSAGQPDVTVGTGGFAMLASSPRELVEAFVQSDSKIVALFREQDPTVAPPAKLFSVTRFDANGAVDTVFGTNGTSRLDTGLYAPSPFALPCVSGNQGFCASALAYDQVADRALVSGWVDGVGLGVMRIWL